MWSAESNQTGAEFGYAVASAGDVNGDGFGDTILGARYFSDGQTREGAAFVYLGSATGLSATPAWTAEGDAAGALFGWSVASAGDVNGDGYSDCLVGANRYTNGQTNEGTAFLYLGSAVGLDSVAAWRFEGNQTGAQLGTSVASAGDVNGDGYSDAVVGAPGASNGQSGEGRIYLFLGGPSGLSPVPALASEGDQIGASFGFAVASAGDVNGDGFGDCLVGANLFDSGQTDEGRAFVFNGNAGDGLDRIPQQLRASTATPIALLGASDAGTSVRLGARGRTALGRDRVRLEWQITPLGSPLASAPLARGAWVTTSAPGAGGSAVTLQELAYGLTQNAPYHWRLRIASRSPFFPHTPWLSPQGNAPTETDFRTSGVVAITDRRNARSLDLRLESPRPAPARETLTLAYTLPRTARVRVAIYDAWGRRVAVLCEGLAHVGTHAVTWDTRDRRGHLVPSGRYAARLETDAATVVQAVTVLR
jgi:hypothetical protein